MQEKLEFVVKNVFSTIEGFEYVGFLICYISDEEYYVYTYDHRDTSKIGVTVDTYLTHLHLREGKWVLSGGYAGTAISCQYDGKTNGPYKNTPKPIGKTIYIDRRAPLSLDKATLDNKNKNTVQAPKKPAHK